MQEVADSKALNRLETIRRLNSRKGWINNDLYRLVLKEDMHILSYEAAKSNPGNMTPGSDDETMDGIGLETISQIIERLRTEKYRPKPVRTSYIPKANGKMRRLGIPSPKDKIVQEVARNILEAIYDSPHGPHFKDSSHGFRRGRSCHTALREIQKWSGVTWYVEGDISQCFDDIDHETLISILRKKIRDERFIRLIRKFLKAGYLDTDRIQKNSLAGTPQGGIISPILSNIYLHELDEFIEQLQAEYEKGKQKRLNPEYRSLQRKRLCLIQQDKAGTAEFNELTKKMRSLPSMLTNDPEFVRIRYVRYADDWLVGITGPKKLAVEIKGRIANFLENKLKLTMSQEKTKITNARSEAASFLGYQIRLGRSMGAEQKIKESTNASGKKFKRRSTGMQVVLKAPIEKIIKRLAQKGFCDKNGKPIDKKAWVVLDEDQIVTLFNSINLGIQNYYRPSDNWSALQRIEYILKFSLAKTLAHKRRTTLASVMRKGDVTVKVQRKEQEKAISFKRNQNWTVSRNAFTNSADVDLVQLSHRLRTRSKLGYPCCICYETSNVQMHHVRHIRKMTDKKVEGFTRVMAILNRKQIPVCRACHLKIHKGEYDGIKLDDLAYDPRRRLFREDTQYEVRQRRKALKASKNVTGTEDTDRSEGNSEANIKAFLKSQAEAVKST